MSWNDDVAYAMTPIKILTLPSGVWPLQKYDTFALVRCIVCGSVLVCFQFSFCIIIKFFFRIFNISSSTAQKTCLVQRRHSENEKRK